MSSWAAKKAKEAEMKALKDEDDNHLEVARKAALAAQKDLSAAAMGKGEQAIFEKKLSKEEKKKIAEERRAKKRAEKGAGGGDAGDDGDGDDAADGSAEAITATMANLSAASNVDKSTSNAMADKLAHEHGTPYQLYDERGIRENARALMRAFRGHFGDSFKQYFAVKALPNPAILQLLVSEGCGLDCSSTAELHIAAALGVAGSDVMYTSNYTSSQDIGVAVAQGAILNLDDASLVDSAAQNAPAGAEQAVAMMKGAVTAANSAFESVQKAVKQATELAESNLTAVAQTAAPKAAKKK
jgi:hypothetical protein